MNVVPLSVETGRETGSAPARRMRAQGQLPGIVYGLGSEAVSVTIERHELRRALTTAAGSNALLELSYAGEKHYALVKDVQRHPVRRDPIHIDFQRIDPETPMQLSVPIVLTGEAKKVTSNGGITEQVLQSLLVSVRPDSIPNEFIVDITDLEIDHALHVSDLTLPAGVTLEVDPEAPIVTATLTRAAVVALQGGDPDAEEGAEFAGAGDGEGDESSESSDDA